jgi:ABC-type Fe3+/spermidine/putrescine transport system ATPase subunit/ABC-type sulfate transport system permease component
MPQKMARSPLAWLGGLIVLYLALPLVAFALRFISAPKRGFHVPGLFPSLWVSISGATISLALITLFGVPLAYVLARSTSRVATVIGLIVQVPLALPPLMSGIVLIYLVGPYTFLGRLFGGRLTDSMVGVVIAMTFVAAPFLIVAARAAFTSVDQGLLDVAATLGHSNAARFLRVAVPVASPGIRAGMLLAWLRAFGEYGAVVILAYNPASLPIYAYNQFSGVGLPTTLAPTALAIGVAAAAVVLSRVRFRGSARGTIALPTPRAPVKAPTTPVRFDVDHRVGSFHLKLAHGSKGSHLAILGPSGSGKSALLRCLAGLYGSGPGSVWYGDRPVHDVPAEQRRVGYVTQGFSLYPHLTVWRHLLFATDATPELAAYWLAHLHLDGLEDRYPSELSGGQRQRVGLAQVLCRSPQVLLLDEPFSALDIPVRLELRRELRRLQHETGLATVLVTHDPEEAAFLSDEVIVIANGRALQSGTSRHVFSRPASPEVARLLGIANLHHATVVSPRQIDSHGALIATDVTDLAPGSSVLWSIRPERVTVAAALDPGESTGDALGAPLTGTISDVADVGTAVDVFITVTDDLELQARTPDLLNLTVGDRCRIVLAPDAISMWAAEPLGPTLSSIADH